MPVRKLRPSFTFDQDRLDQLRAIAPEAFADGKINWEVLKEALGEHLEDEDTEHFGLFWPGKHESRRLASRPSKGTLVPQTGLGVDEGTTHNLFIEGDNLEVLKLLQRSYAGRVKMIYIDPPYNTGNDFIYSDDYSEPLIAYLQRTGQADEAGQLLTTNTHTSGRFHSNWLNMMYPRLLLARRLLRNDGVVFVSIDDHEIHSLRMLMNEIFGEENFLATFTWRRRASSALAQKLVSVDHEYVVAYHASEFENLLGKPKDYAGYQNPDNDPEGPWTSGDLTVGMTREQRPNQFYTLVDPETGREFPPNPNRVWAFIPETMDREIESGHVLFPDDPNKRPMLKRYKKNLKSDVNPVSTWIRGTNDPDDEDAKVQMVSGLNSEGTRLIQEIFGKTVFSYSKPISLLTSLLKFYTQNNDLILDFFAGSAATAQATMELNREDGDRRHFIMVQLPEPLPEPRIVEDSTVFYTIADIGRERIRRVSAQMQAETEGQFDLRPDEDLGFKSYRLDRSHFKEWQEYEGDDTGRLATLFDRFESPLIAGWQPEALLTEILLIEGFPLDSRVEPQDHFTANQVHLVTSDFHRHRLFVCLDDTVAPETVARLDLQDQDVFVCLDTALTDEIKVRLSDTGNIHVI